MDGNQNPAQLGQNLTPNQTQESQQAVPTQSAHSITQQPQEQMSQAAVPPKKSHIMRTLLIMIILAIIVLLSVLIYVSFVNKQSNEPSSMQTQNTTSITISTPAPSTNEQELNSIDVGNADEDLKTVDADLQSL